MKELTQIDGEQREFEITTSKRTEILVLYFGKAAVVGAIGVVSGVPGQDGADTRGIAAMTAGDIFLVEYTGIRITHRARMLVFVSNAQIKIAVDPLQELRVDKILFLAEHCFGAVSRMVPQTPEIVGVITVGGLESDDMVFFGEEDGGIEDQDQQ